MSAMADDLVHGPLCGLKGCPEPMVPGAWIEVEVPTLGPVRVGLCLGHFDTLSAAPSAHFSMGGAGA